MSALTKEGIEVKAGQVWRDLDPRVKRTVTVLSVEGRFAYVQSSYGSKSRIQIARMHRHAQGVALVSEGGAA